MSLELSIILFHLESCKYVNKLLIKGMVPLVCENLLCGARSLNVVTGCVRKLFKISISCIATLFFILQSVFIYNQLMSTKKEISSLCKLYSVYEEIPEEFLDETEVDSYFYHNILDISQSHKRIVRVSKRSNKKSFAFKVFHFQIYSSDLFSRKKSTFPKTNSSLYSTV